MGVCASAPHDDAPPAPTARYQATSPSKVSLAVESSHAEVAANLKLIPLLSKLSQAELMQLAAAMQTRHYAYNQPLMKEGDEGDEFFIIRSGSCAVLKWNSEAGENVQVAELKPRDYAGEAALLNNSKRGASVVSSSAEGTSVYTLDRASFQQLFGANKRLNITFAKRAAISAETGGGRGRATSGAVGETAGTGTGSGSHAPANARVVKTASEVTAISSAIHENLLFRNLAPAQRETIISAMWLRRVHAGVEVITQGDLGEFFYVVAEGHFEIFVTRDGRTAKVATRGPGDSFGELALMYNAPRAATVRAVSNASLWVVDRSTFRRAITSAQDAKLQEYEEFLRGVHSFEVLLANERSRIAEALEECAFPKGHQICRQGQPGDTLFIVKSGEVVVTQTQTDADKEVELTRYHPGQWKQRTHARNTCMHDASLQKMDGFVLTRSVLSASTCASRGLYGLSLIPLFSPALLASSVSPHSSPGNVFGERALLSSEPRAATCTAVTDVVCLYLNRDAFSLLLGSLEDVFRARIAGYDAMSPGAKAAATADPKSKAVAPATNAKSAYADAYAAATAAAAAAATAANAPNSLDTSLRQSDLIVIGTLGKGSFGHVQLVKHAVTSRTYALKTVGKQQVVQLGQQEHLLSEKRVMAKLNHPSLIRLYATFQSRDALYFVLEPSLGGELFSVLRSRTHFDEETARFYTAGVVLAFQHMHSQQVRTYEREPTMHGDEGK